ncbi:hypothetical protein GE09DRAFT_1192078 [Coniochaeta sp. 2T2.1]|nr:hypothetical protein GE09DRAFT_1192078 [Coniochaeta sp. 2T2.1]
MPRPLSTESNERVRAMVRWLLEVNGGALPARGTPDKGIDSLADDIASFSIGDITANMPEAVKEHVEDLEEDELEELIAKVGRLSVPCDDELEELIAQVGRLSVPCDDELEELIAQVGRLSVPCDDELPLSESELEAEHHEPTPAPAHPPQDEDGDTAMSDFPTTTACESQPVPNPRCWTTGQPVCDCPTFAWPFYGPPPDRPYDDDDLDGIIMSCGMDCPVGESEAETNVREGYSPFCGLPGCVCTEGHDWEGTVDHPYDPDCLRNDCGCRNFPMNE